MNQQTADRARFLEALIFLGASGWGPTHFWEAERALARYRHDPDYRLLPVALPGLRDADAARLGDGGVFQQMNWADFRAGPRDPDAVHKLLATVAGGGVVLNRGPARLTPYQIRRDAARWRNAGTQREQSSIFYRSQQLNEAEQAVAENPDFAVTVEVQPFLAAAQSVARTRLRRTVLGAILVAVVTLGAFAVALSAYFLAETRRLESTSRELAILADDVPRPDDQPLIGLAAFDAAPTPEARGMLMRLLERWRFLRRMEHPGGVIPAIGSGGTFGEEEEVIATTSSGLRFFLGMDPLHRLSRHYR